MVGAEGPPKAAKTPNSATPAKRGEAPKKEKQGAKRLAVIKQQGCFSYRNHRRLRFLRVRQGYRVVFERR